MTKDTGLLSCFSHKARYIPRYVSYWTFSRVQVMFRCSFYVETFCVVEIVNISVWIVYWDSSHKTCVWYNSYLQNMFLSISLSLCLPAYLAGWLICCMFVWLFPYLFLPVSSHVSQLYISLYISYITTFVQFLHFDMWYKWCIREYKSMGEHSFVRMIWAESSEVRWWSS